MWAEIGRELVSAKLLSLYACLGCVSCVHLQGHVRLRLARQPSQLLAETTRPEPRPAHCFHGPQLQAMVDGSWRVSPELPGNR